MALTSDAIFSANANVPFPSGYTKPTTSIVQTTVVTVRDQVHSMTKSSGVSTTEILGIDAMITAFETFLITFIDTTLGIDTVSDTVTAIATITKVVVGTAADDIFLNDATGTLEITFDVTIENA